MKKQLLLLAVLIFLLNLTWEVAHSSLYDWNKFPLENNVYSYIPKIIISGIGDLFLISIIIVIISLKNKNISWVKKPSKLDYLLLTLLSIVFAIGIELREQSQDKWFYADAMPALFGIGISPLLQLAITSLLALWLIRK